MPSLEAPVPDDDTTAELKITYPTDRVCVLTVHCELDMVTTPALGQLLTQELAVNHKAVLIDLAGCKFMGSSGLAVLVAAREHAARAGTHLALAGLNRTVTRSLQATALDAMFTIYPTTGDALTDLAAT